MNDLIALLDDGNDKKIIVETGFDPACLHDATEYARNRPQCELASVGLDFFRLAGAHKYLELLHATPFCTFHLQDPLKFLQGQTWIDAAFLNTRNGLNYAVEEFRLAASAGATLIVMTDYQSTSALAVTEAKKLGWTYITHDRYYILRRP